VGRGPTALGLEIAHRVELFEHLAGHRRSAVGAAEFGRLRRGPSSAGAIIFGPTPSSGSTAMRNAEW
jgi:hypothetical protein